MNGPAAIVQVTPAGTITEFPLPEATAVGGLTVGPDGNLWFSDDSADGAAIGSLDPTTPQQQQSTGGGGIGNLDPTPPHVTGVVAVAHARKAITSIILDFNEALDPGTVESGGFFSLTSGAKRGHKIVFSKGVKIRSVSYDGTAYTVRLKLARPQKRTLMVTVRAGIVAADGISSFSDFTAVVR